MAQAGRQVARSIHDGTLFGCTRAQAAQVPFTNIFVEQNLANQMLERALEGGRWQGEVQMIAKEGRRFPASLRATPVLDDAYDVSGALFIFNDITERKQLEAQLAQSQNLKSIGQLAAGIAHEINTPMQYVGDNTRFLQESFSDLLAALGMYEECIQAALQGWHGAIPAHHVRARTSSRDLARLHAHADRRSATRGCRSPCE